MLNENAEKVDVSNVIVVDREFVNAIKKETTMNSDQPLTFC